MKTEYVQVEEAQYHRMIDAMALAHWVLASVNRGGWVLVAGTGLDGDVERAEQALWKALFPGAGK
jgi:hypothetical protein